MKDMKNKRHKEHEKELEKNEQKYYQQQSFVFQFNIYMTEYIFFLSSKEIPTIWQCTVSKIEISKVHGGEQKVREG